MQKWDALGIRSRKTSWWVPGAESLVGGLGRNPQKHRSVSVYLIFAQVCALTLTEVAVGSYYEPVPEPPSFLPFTWEQRAAVNRLQGVYVRMVNDAPMALRMRCRMHGVLSMDDYSVSKKRPAFKLSLTLSNLNRFSKFLHCWKSWPYGHLKWPKHPWDRKIRNQSIYDTIRYDTIYLRALKSWRNGQLSLSQGTETKIGIN